MRCFFSNHLGSRYFSLGNRCPAHTECGHWKLISESDSVWIGEVSWLKAGLTGDDTYIPEPVESVHSLIGENLPVLDAELWDKVMTAVGVPNARAAHYDTEGGIPVALWLDEHMGCRLFTVSW